MSSLEPKSKKALASNALNLDAQGSQVAQPSHHILKPSSESVKIVPREKVVWGPEEYFHSTQHT